MKIHTIIQARTGSTRLPDKVNAKIGSKTLLQMVLERCVKAEIPEKTIVAVHGDEWGWLPIETDDVRVVDGPEEPAARFLKVLAEYPCDGFVRVCADSPFIDWQEIDEVAKALATARRASYVTNDDTHPGNQTEAFRTRQFVSDEACMTGEEREHLGLWYRRAERLTVDTPADLERARLIVSRMNKDHTEYTAAECLALLRG